MSETKSRELNAVYFAYGTLLGVKGMREYCPSAEPVGVMRLKGYRLGFARCGADPTVGGCTLVEDAGNTMCGVLYRLPAEELARLDKASGLDRGLWATHAVTLTDHNGREVPANTYRIPATAGDYSPPEPYTRKILEGAEEWDLPDPYIAQLRRIIREAQAGK
jgi:gamma-glutamylcyclotransferase